MMKIKLLELEYIKPDESLFIIGGHSNKDADKGEEGKLSRKERRVMRKARRKLNSDTTDTLKNDTFKI